MYQSMTVFYKDGKPSWKTKRPIFFVGPNRDCFIDLCPCLKLNIDKLFFRLEDDDVLTPLKEYCNYL